MNFLLLRISFYAQNLLSLLLLQSAAAVVAVSVGPRYEPSFFSVLLFYDFHKMPV